MADVSWDAACDLFVAARGTGAWDAYRREHAPAAIERYCETRDGELRVLASYLADPRRKWFVAFLAKEGRRLPSSLHEAMLRAAIDEPNPSYNRSFVEPCVVAMGHAAVLHALHDEIEHGANAAGAAQAIYWVGAVRLSEPATDELRQEWTRGRRLMLETFVRREDVDLRRRILPHLNLQKPESYPEDVRALIGEVVAIARAHPDEYIRHRVEIQLGSGGPYRALPPKER